MNYYRFTIYGKEWEAQIKVYNPLLREKADKMKLQGFFHGVIEGAVELAEKTIREQMIESENQDRT